MNALLDATQARRDARMGQAYRQRFTALGGNERGAQTAITGSTAAMIARHLLATRPATLNEYSLCRSPGFSWARDAKRRAAALAALDRACWWIQRPVPWAQRASYWSA
jgi:hypothetical protein